MTHKMELPIQQIYTGKSAPLGPRGLPSAIDKAPAEAPWHIEANGLLGDQQADLRNHGGLEKALHHYPRDHYASWAEELPQIAGRLETPPAFGENLSTEGITEADACIGDIFKLGSARIQISQARQPCWKLNAFFEVEDMALRVQTSGRTGWYYRVLEAGVVNPGDTLTLDARPQPDWPLARIITLLYNRTLAADELSTLSKLPELAEGWRKLFRRRMQRQQVENWNSRLSGEDLKSD